MRFILRNAIFNSRKDRKRMGKMKNAKIWTFVSGLFLAFDFTGIIARDILPQVSLPENKTARENIAADWQNVGDTIRKVM